MIERNRCFDVAKGIGILCVVFGHACMHFWGADCLTRKVIYAFHMPLFFVISGVFLGRVLRRSWKEELQKQFSSIWIPAIFFLSLGSALKFCEPGHFPWRDLAFSLWRGHPLTNVPLWFLVVLSASRILVNRMPFFLTVRGLCIVSMMAVVSVLIPTQESIKMPLMIETWPVALLYMGMGYIGGNVKLRGGGGVAMSMVLMSVVVVYSSSNGQMSMAAHSYNGILDLPVACIGSASVLFFASAICSVDVVGRMLAWLGQNSLHIMGLDTPMSGVLRVVLRLMGFEITPVFFLLHLFVLVLLVSMIRWIGRRFAQ